MGASDYVWALVSGLPRREREERFIMLWQAAIDDSGNDPKEFAYVLGGFVARPLQWAKFSDAWQKALKKPPGASYFKHNEAMALKGQFDEKKGWTERKRDDRMVELAYIIKDHVHERFSVGIRHEDYRRYLHGIPVQKRMKALEDPYFILFYDILLLVGAVHSLEPTVNPCEFVFDNQGAIGRRAANWWPTFRTGLSQAKFDLSPYFVESEPTFKSDIEFRPLQAADLFAGQLRRMMATDKLIIPPTPAFRIIEQMSRYHRVLDYKYLAPLRNQFMSMASQIDKTDPDSLKYVLGRPTQKRRRK